MVDTWPEDKKNKYEADFPGFTPKLFERVDRAWKAVDKDGSGSVSTDELAGIMTELGQDLSDEQLREFIVSVDTNGDGTCDEHEFYNSMYQKMKTQQNKGCMAGFKLWKFENWRKFKTITTTFSILAGLVSIGIAISNYVDFANADAAIGQMLATWQATPVSGAVFVTAGAACPTGYTKWKKNPYFPGVPDKCNCANRVCPASYYQSHSGRCTGDETSVRYGCIETSERVGSDCNAGSSSSGNSGSSGSSGSSSRTRARHLACTTEYECDCSSRVCDTSTATGRLCSTTEKNEQCVDEEGFEAKEMHVWRGLNLCVRFGGLDTLEREAKLDLDTNTCAAGFTNTCSADSTFATNSTAQCFGDDDNCPLTRIRYLTSTFSMDYDIELGLPVIDLQSGDRTGTGGYDQSWTDSGKTFTNPAVEWDATRFEAFDSIAETDLYADNLVPTRFASATRSWALGGRREIGWDNNCPVGRQTVVDVEPRVDGLRAALLGMLIVIIVDFMWTLIELCTIADSTEWKHLAIRSFADCLSFGINIPYLLAATALGAGISSVVTDISGCSDDQGVIDSFELIASKAAKMAGTNIVIIALKGIKTIFMSAIVQHGIYVLKTMCTGKKQARKDIEMAFTTV